MLATFSLLLVLATLLYIFVILADPYDNLPISPNIDRVPVSKLQRLFHPALARKTEFDSAVIGNSNIRLLKPQQLNTIFDAQFVNLGMDAASPWEQQQILNVFIANHESINNVIFGLDYLWCYDKFANKKFVAGRQARDFPEWMYDEKPYNNFPPLNLTVLEHSWLQILSSVGLRPSEYGRDGYHEFTGPMEDYKLAKARINIYGSSKPKPFKTVKKPVKKSRKQRAKLPFVALNRLDQMLAALPATANKVIIFSPYHAYFQSPARSHNGIVWQECKKRTAALASKYPNSYVLDFMIKSPITREDSNYWDVKHYTVAVAQELGIIIGDAVNKGVKNPNYRMLYPQQINPQ